MICRMWDVHAATGRYLSTDLIVSDTKGDLMHCNARGNIAHNFLRLKEWAIYSVKNFTVVPNKDEFCVMRFTDLMLEFDGKTTVQKSFVKSDDVARYVTNVGRTTQTRIGSKTLDFYLANCSFFPILYMGQQIRVTLWGGLGDMLIQKRTRHVGLYPLVITAVLVKLYNNRLYLSSTSSTLIIDDEKIPVLKQLKTNDSGVELTKEIMPANNTAPKAGTLENVLMWARNQKYDVKIDKVRIKKGWNYPSCGGEKCKKGNLDRKEGHFWCDSCNILVEYHVMRYKLELEISDDTTEVVVVMFDETATSLLGCSASSILDFEELVYFLASYNSTNTFTYLRLQDEEDHSGLPTALANIVVTSEDGEGGASSGTSAANEASKAYSQFKFLTDTLQDFGTMPIFKRTFAQDLDLLEQHLTKEIISQTDCKTILTKLRTTFENAFNLEFKERMQKYTRFDAQSFKDAMICNMDSIGKYMLEIILHQQRTPHLLKQKKLMQTQEDHSNSIPALHVDSLKVDLVVIQNICSEKEDSNSETASSKSVKLFECPVLTSTTIRMAKVCDTCLSKFQELKTVSYHKLYDILKQHQNEVNEIRAERLARTANPLALVAQQQPVYHPQNHPTQNNQYSSNRSQQPTRNRGKAIVNSSAPTYDQEPVTVTEDDEMSKEKEIDKLMALISLSFKKIYKPTNNNLRTSSNTSRANQDNSPRINRGTGYENQRVVNVAGARENVGTQVVQKSGIQCYNCKEYGHVSRECQKPKRVKDAAYHKEKMLLCKQEEAGVQLNAEQADWKDDTDDESDDQELEAHYMYMAQIQEVTPDPVDNSRPIFDAEPLHKVQNNNENYNVFAIVHEHPEQPESSNDIYLEEQGATKITIDSLDICYDKN
ncbi:integrase, catalytic region, zinc finger, CCHC-type containing protein [Tanacetum coccineum]